MSIEAQIVAAVEEAICRGLSARVDRLAYTVDEAAEALRVSSYTIRKMCEAGTLRTIDTGSTRTVISRRSLEEVAN